MIQRTVIQVLLVTYTGGCAKTLPEQAEIIQHEEEGFVLLLDDCLIRIVPVISCSPFDSLEE